MGKDTAAGIIVAALEQAGKKVAVTAFAESLKRMAIEILGLKENEVYGTNEQKDALSHIQWDGFPLEVRKKYALPYETSWGTGWEVPRSGPMTNREVLQVMGTDIFRAIYDNVWAHAPFNRNWVGTDVVVLTDCRFPNEKSVTEERGGVIIRLERKTGLSDNHPSETSLDNASFKYRFENNGSVEDLKAYLLSILETEKIINGL